MLQGGCVSLMEKLPRKREVTLRFPPRSVFFADCSITKFLNRILGLEVHKQNLLFQYFSDTFDYLIDRDKKVGKYDMGILGKEPAVNSPFLNCCERTVCVPRGW